MLVGSFLCQTFKTNAYTIILWRGYLIIPNNQATLDSSTYFLGSCLALINQDLMNASFYFRIFKQAQIFFDFLYHLVNKEQLLDKTYFLFPDNIS